MNIPKDAAPKPSASRLHIGYEIAIMSGLSAARFAIQTATLSTAEKSALQGLIDASTAVLATFGLQ